MNASGRDSTRLAIQVQKDVEAFKAHPWWAIEKGYVFTEDEKPPRGEDPVRVFPAEPYLKTIADLWLENPLGLLMKSRQMMISWLFAWLHTWDAISNRGRHNFFQGKRQDDVAAMGTKGILGRARFMRDHLPPFIRPKVISESMISENYEHGSNMEAIPEGKDIIRSKVISKLFMDELAFHDTGEENWNAAIPAAHGGGTVWGVSTPNGREFMYQQADDSKKWDNWRDWPEIATGIHGYKNRRGVLLVALHYTAKKAWRDATWQEGIRSGYTSTRYFLRERELDFSLMEGIGVWSSEFDKNFHVIDNYVPDGNLPLYRGWDTGYNGQSVCFAQINHQGQLVLFDHVIYKQVPLNRVVQEVQVKTQRAISGALTEIGLDERYRKRETTVLDYGDPATKQNNSSGTSDRDTLSKYGIRLVSRTSKGRKNDLIEQVRQLLLPRSDGKPALVVARNSSEMEHVITMFQGGYHYSKTREGKAEKELPEKDGFFDHIADSIQYLIDNVRPSRTGYLSEDPNQDWWKDTEGGIGNTGGGQFEEDPEGPLAWRFS